MSLPRRSLADLRPHDHVAFLYETEEEHRAVVTAFVRQGLERHARVIYIAHSHPKQAFLAALRDSGLQVEPFLASGQLAVVSASQAYLCGGVFDPQRMLAYLEREAAHSLAQRYRALYVTGEMAWALDGAPGCERLVEYERDCDALLPGTACVGLCQYDRRRFDPELLLQVMAAHPLVMVGTALYQNTRYIPPATLRRGAATALLDQWLEDLAAWQQAQEPPAEADPLLDPRLRMGREARLAARSFASARAMRRAIEHRLHVEGALAQVSTLLAAEEAVDLTSILAILGEAVDASRAYIFRFRDGTRRADNTDEWCAPGVEAQKPNLQDVDCTPLAWWMGKLQRNEEIAIADLAQLPPEADPERRVLEPQSIRALLVVPMFSRGQLTGFLGFDDTRGPRQWPAEDIRLLRTAAETLAAHEERRRAAETLSFLAEASRVLAGSLDYQVTLQSVARLCVPTLADWCVVNIVGCDGLSRPVAHAHADPAREPLIEALRRSYSPAPRGPHPAGEVERTGQWAIHSDISDDDWAAVAPDAEFLRIIRQLGIRSSMTVPLVARGRVLGSLSLASGRPHRYGAADLALAEDLARRCALAVDNARLYHEARQAVRARDEFLSVAAHELKTPLTGLRGFAQLTLRRLARDGAFDPAETRRAMEVIDQQSLRLTHLVEQLLDVSRIEAGQLRLRREVTELAGLVEGAVAFAHARYSQQPIVVHCEPVRALVDPLRLEQVLANLLDNACKFNLGSLPIEVELSAHDGTVALSVRDHGVGIAPEDRERIFERFYPAETGRPTAGMGLGLYLSQRIVSLHGGHIAVDCPPDGGARFVVTLPLGLSPTPPVETPGLDRCEPRKRGPGSEAPYPDR